MYSFPMADNEEIIKKSHASLHLEDSAFTGAFYLTSDRLVFVGYVMDITRKHIAEIPLAHVDEVLGEKTFFVIPNVISITSTLGKSMKVIVDPGSRKAWLEAIRQQLQKI